MKFKPVSPTYDFRNDVLIKSFPPYMQTAITDWVFDVLDTPWALAFEEGYRARLTRRFINEINITFRKKFPQDFSAFIETIFGDEDLTANFIAYCLQRLASGGFADKLEEILSSSGSGWEVIKIRDDSMQEEVYSYTLAERVSPVVKGLSKKALSDNELLEEAWNYCYSVSPDYEKCVSRSCDFLEAYLGKKYYQNDPKPQLKKFIHFFEADPNILNYKGDTIVSPKSMLLTLLREASNIRGQHTAGKGRNPIKEEAEFVLHTAILIWNMHQK